MKRHVFSVGEEVEARYEGGQNWHDASIVGHEDGSSHYEIQFKSGYATGFLFSYISN
jgi:hypothetical protein